MALGGEGDDERGERLVLHLHRAADVPGDARGHRGRGVELVAPEALEVLVERLYQDRPVAGVDGVEGGAGAAGAAGSAAACDRSRSTSSRIVAATCAFEPRAIGRSPSRPTSVTSLSVVSKPMSVREMSLTTTKSSPLRSSLPRP